MDRKGRTGDLFAPRPSSVAQTSLARAPVVQASATAPSGARSPAGGPPAPPRLVATRPARSGPWRQLWIALRVPDLALDAGTPPQRPVAVVETGPHGEQTVHACNARAARLGITTGLGLSAAQALAPDLVVQPRAPAAEARRLEDLARLATAYTPVVCLESAEELLLEVRASQRLFGGLAALLERLRTDLAAHTGTACLGVAPTATAALWLARAGDERPVVTPGLLAGRLNALPLAVTRWPPAVQELLARLGLQRLGDLVRLPRDGLAHRFTPERLRELDEAYGRAPAVRRPHRLPERFRTRLDLEAEIEQQALLEVPLRELLDALGRFLEERGAGVTACVLGLEHRGRPTTRVVLRRSRPAGRGGEWHRLLSERLMRLDLPAAVNAVSLRSGVVVPLVMHSASLPGVEDPVVADQQAQQLLDRLRARLGEGAVAGVGLVEEHRPEAATRTVRPRLPGRAPGPAPATARRAAPRPLWLLNAAVPLPLRRGLPWLEGGLRLESGPERIESGWWDEADVCRDYYVARLDCGVRLWIYRERAAAGGDAPGRWFWHGVYA